MRMQWNKFVQTHNKTNGFSAAVSAALPKNLIFDQHNKKLPTPYSLFKEWATINLKDDWSATKFTGGFVICVSSNADAQIIINKFKAIGHAKATPACPQTVQIGYSDSSYKDLAQEVGYALR